MKNEVIQVYRNTDYEEKVKKDLQISKNAMQKILNEYLALEIGPCMGLNDLVLRPRGVFDRAVNDMITVPQTSGPFKINPAQYKEQLVLPDPSALFDACKKALQLPFCAMYGIFIVNDDLVEIDEEGAKEFIDSQSIYVKTPEKIKLAEDILKYIELTNQLNSKIDLQLKGSAAHQYYRNIFKISQETMIDQFELKIIPEKLREWLQG